MRYGNLNRRFGWLWLLLFMSIGLIIEIRLIIDPVYAANYSGTAGIGQMRSLFRAAHGHGNLLAVVNILYGLYIDTANLPNGLKRAGSVAAVVGAILQPIGLFGAAFLEPVGALALIGGLLIILAVAIISWGHLTQSDMS